MSDAEWMALMVERHDGGVTATVREFWDTGIPAGNVRRVVIDPNR